MSDGTDAVTGEFTINVEQVTEAIRVGDAPTRVTTMSQFADAWSDPLVTSILHTATASSATQVWSPVQFSVLSVGVLSGGDIFSGDLGVSGQTMATSAVKQELDGTEALRFTLNTEATGVTLDLSRLYANDDLTGFNEAGRLRLLDANGAVVGESTFVANSSSGELTISLSADAGFTTVELAAGAYDGSEFVFGGYSSAGGELATDPYADSAGKWHGSDFLVDWIEFEVPVTLVGVPEGAAV